jgi:hypothetical protein
LSFSGTKQDGPLAQNFILVRRPNMAVLQEARAGKKVNFSPFSANGTGDDAKGGKERS